MKVTSMCAQSFSCRSMRARTIVLAESKLKQQGSSISWHSVCNLALLLPSDRQGVHGACRASSGSSRMAPFACMVSFLPSFQCGSHRGGQNKRRRGGRKEKKKDGRKYTKYKGEKTLKGQATKAGEIYIDQQPVLSYICMCVDWKTYVCSLCNGKNT